MSQSVVLSSKRSRVLRRVDDQAARSINSEMEDGQPSTNQVENKNERRGRKSNASRVGRRKAEAKKRNGSE